MTYFLRSADTTQALLLIGEDGLKTVNRLRQFAFKVLIDFPNLLPKCGKFGDFMQSVRWEILWKVKYNKDICSGSVEVWLGDMQRSSPRPDMRKAIYCESSQNRQLAS